MKISGKILAVLIGIIVLVSSCQKENLPVPVSGGSYSNGSTMRTGDPSTGDGNHVNGDDEPVCDSIVGGGDDDRDGGGVVGGGDDDRDGGKRSNPGGGKN